MNGAAIDRRRFLQNLATGKTHKREQIYFHPSLEDAPLS